MCAIGTASTEVRWIKGDGSSEMDKGRLLTGADMVRLSRAGLCERPPPVAVQDMLLIGGLNVEEENQFQPLAPAEERV